jgi:hypothetical protein
MTSPHSVSSSPVSISPSSRRGLEVMQALSIRR